MTNILKPRLNFNELDELNQLKSKVKLFSGNSDFVTLEELRTLKDLEEKRIADELEKDFTRTLKQKIQELIVNTVLSSTSNEIKVEHDIYLPNYILFSTVGAHRMKEIIEGIVLSLQQAGYEVFHTYGNSQQVYSIKITCKL